MDRPPARPFAVTQVLALLLACASTRGADAPGVATAPDRDFESVRDAVEKEAPGDELIDRLYDFMERYPHDPRADRVQYWVGAVQQRRRFHNEAIKEFGFVVSEFPKSPLVLPALKGQIVSYTAVAQPERVAECYQKIYALRPADFKSNPQATEVYREAVTWLAERKAEAKDVDAAVALLMQLPTTDEALARVVKLYVAAGRHQEALDAVHRLPESERLKGYVLMADTYAARPAGAANLFALLDKILAEEKPREEVDHLLRHMVEACGSRGAPDRHKALERVVEKYPRLKRWVEYGLCNADRATDVERLARFVSDYASGDDVEQCKLWGGEYYEAAGAGDRAREAYGRLTDRPAGHFRIAETWYGTRAKVKDFPRGRAELTEIVKRFYSPATSAEALLRRATLESEMMHDTKAALDTLRELVDRFPKEGEFAARALYTSGALLRTLKRQDEAIADYLRVINGYPTSALVRASWLQIAGCHEEKGEPTRAIDVLKSVVRKFPRTTEASAAHTRLETKYDVADTEVSD